MKTVDADGVQAEQCDELTLGGEVSVLRLEPGDVGVFTYPVKITWSERDRLKETFEHIFPGNKALVLDDGVTFGVVRKADVDKVLKCPECGSGNVRKYMHVEDKEGHYSTWARCKEDGCRNTWGPVTKGE